MTKDQEEDTCFPQSFQRDTDRSFLGADMELPPHVGGLQGHGTLWDPTEPLFPHQSL